MNSFATTLSHVRILYSKNCSLISLLDFLHTYSIIIAYESFQFIQSIHLFLHFILMTPHTFFTYFLPHSYYFLCNSKIFTTTTGTRHEKGRQPRTTDDLKEGTKIVQHPKSAGIGEQLQLLEPFMSSLGGEQREPLPTVKTG